jgi:hypothetical protein
MHDVIYTIKVAVKVDVFFYLCKLVVKYCQKTSNDPFFCVNVNVVTSHIVSGQKWLNFSEFHQVIGETSGE